MRVRWCSCCVYTYCSTASSWLGLTENAPISALPQEPPITSINCFDPLRRYFLDLFDQLGLGKCSRQRRDDVNVISNTADAHKFSTKVTADCRQISVHARLHVVIEPRLAILRAKDDVKDDFTERLGHGANDDPTARRSESRFQRWRFRIPRILGRRPGLEVNAAPLALICALLLLCSCS